jgi:hypothetical protein
MHQKIPEDDVKFFPSSAASATDETRIRIIIGNSAGGDAPY